MAFKNWGHVPSRRWKEFYNMRTRLDTKSQYDGQTDRRTDLLNDIALCMHSMLMRDKPGPRA